MAEIERYEYAVVGGGKGGKTLAMSLSSSGHKTVLVERDKIGGSCIRVACVPSKTMMRSAQVLSLIQDAFEYGIDAAPPVLIMDKVLARKRAVVEEMTRLTWEQFRSSGMEFVLGSARFVAPKTLEVEVEGGRRLIAAEKIFIGTGTRPLVPELYRDTRPLTSESLMELAYVPDSLLIVGGGYIGVEFAQMFQRFGSEVTIIEHNDQLLSREDPDVSAAVQKILEDEGIDVYLGTEVMAAKREGVEATLNVRTKKGDRVLSGSQLLVAIGRTPNTEALNLESTGVVTDERGFIEVNDRLETSCADIWALGDVNGGPQFTHVSLDDFRIVLANMNGGSRTTRDRLVPYTVFTDPELARVGLTEKAARLANYEVRVAHVPMSAVPAARTRGQTEGFMKAVIDKGSAKILGVSILCAEAAEIMAVVEVAMQANLPYTFLRDNIFAHPTLAEGLNYLFAEQNIRDAKPDLAVAALSS